MNKHDDFILTPIIEVLEQGLHSISQLEKGIEHHALYDYVLQSIFLKMTGFQEQKCKCISWTLATHDYTYRYEDGFNITNGYSSYENKNSLFKNLYKNIGNKKVITNKKQFAKNINNDLENLFKRYSIYNSIERNILHIQKELNKWENQFLQNSQLFENLLQTYYELLYKHRNRCAHNTLSYQRNLPTLDVLASEHQPYNNYYVFFILLILIDKIFIEFYKQYLEEQHFEF